MFNLVWVRLPKYCELTGEPPATVANRMKSGGWIQGVHWRTGPDRRRWVNLPQAQAWVEGGQLKASRSGAMRPG